MTSRKIRPIFDDLTPQYSYRLDTSLADYLGKAAPRTLPISSLALPLPIPHHLLYFEPTKPQSDLLHDGTNPDQSPGDPFVRRMWAGGAVHYNTDNPLLMNNTRGVCIEGIRDVTIKGNAGSEKIFVGIERRLAYLDPSEEQALSRTSLTNDKAISEIEDSIRTRLWMDKDTDFGPSSVIERRNIVFMRQTPPASFSATEAAETPKPGKILKPTHSATFFDNTITPDEKLMFRFSALTFNAHAIHLDPEYSRNVEGHRERLFHGPLSFTFLMTFMQMALAKNGDGSNKERVKFVEYKNLAPLYCHEPARFCGHQVGEGKYEVWAETPEGGMAVKGMVKTEKV